MLHPQGNRQLLLESLRPPPDYALDYAIGTTFSLDLLTLLTAPLAFTFFDLEDEQERTVANPMALLETLRRYADRMSIFCQAGQIALPRHFERLYAYLEQTVHEVVAPHPDGVFHPKLWVLRFTPLEEADTPIRYRLLCLSRNLTPDRSWDTILLLDGILGTESQTDQVNQPVCDFLATLPDLVVHPLSEQAASRIALMQDELQTVTFDLPSGFDTLAFWPLGIDGYTDWPFPRQPDRMLVMSPFVSSTCLARLTAQRSHNILISRAEELHALRPDQMQGFKQVYVLEPALQTEMSRDTEAADDTELLVGLHAKLYIADAGQRAHIWTGSANATHAAFNTNVEFLVELTGAREFCGIDALLRQTGETDLIDLLQPFIASSDTTLIDPAQQHLDHLVDTARYALARASLMAQVVPVDDDDRFHLHVCQPQAGALVLPDWVQVHCWPITLAEAMARSPDSTVCQIASFGPISFAALTSFIAFSVTAVDSDCTSKCRFVLNLPLEGVPVDRLDRTLIELISSREHLMRFLLFLLADSRADIPEEILLPSAETNGRSHRRANGSTTISFPLFEAMARALDRNPARLDQIAHLVQDLARTPEGRALLPEDFERIWHPIWTARERLRS